MSIRDTTYPCSSFSACQTCNTNLPARGNLLCKCLGLVFLFFGGKWCQFPHRSCHESVGGRAMSTWELKPCRAWFGSICKILPVSEKSECMHGVDLLMTKETSACGNHHGSYFHTPEKYSRITTNRHFWSDCRMDTNGKRVQINRLHSALTKPLQPAPREELIFAGPSQEFCWPTHGSCWAKH
jgi:hypothetical protein